MTTINVEIEKQVLARFFSEDHVSLYSKVVDTFSKGGKLETTEEQKLKLQAMDVFMVHMSSLSNDQYLN